MNVGREIIPARTTEREAEGEGEREEGKRDKPRPAHPDFLETENWIVNGSVAWISADLEAATSVRLDSRNRCQSLRIVPLLSFFVFLFRAAPYHGTSYRFPRTLLTKSLRRNSTFREIKRCLARSPGSLGSLEGNEIPRSASRSAIKLPEISEGKASAGASSPASIKPNGSLSPTTIRPFGSGEENALDRAI